MSIITRFLYKIKLYVFDHLEEAGVSLIIVFVGISSFGLGRYSVIDQVRSDKVTFEYRNDDELGASKSPNMGQVDTVKLGDKTIRSSEDVVASKNGTKYYLPWCGAAQRIADKNKVFFASALEAERAGYGKASNCKGM